MTSYRPFVACAALVAFALPLSAGARGPGGAPHPGGAPGGAPRMVAAPRAVAPPAMAASRSAVPRGFDVSPDTGPMNFRPATATRVPVFARPTTTFGGRGGEAGRASVAGAYRPVAGNGFRPPRSGGRPPEVPRGGWPRHRPGVFVANPRYRGGAWGWNSGNPWTGYSDYWGNGFWGPFALGSLSGAFVAADQERSEPYYQVTADSPGAQLLANYDLTQTPCGSPDLVVLDGPDGGTICAYPNATVSPGTYDIDESTLSLTSG